MGKTARARNARLPGNRALIRNALWQVRSDWHEDHLGRSCAKNPVPDLPVDPRFAHGQAFKSKDPALEERHQTALPGEIGFEIHLMFQERKGITTAAAGGWLWRKSGIPRHARSVRKRLGGLRNLLR